VTAGTQRLRGTLARMIADASDGAVTAEQALAGNHSLAALGLTSLALLRLIDAIEDAFGVDLDLGADSSSFDSVGALADHLAGALTAR
jgi:acyl carrier protein